MPTFAKAAVHRCLLVLPSMAWICSALMPQHPVGKRPDDAIYWQSAYYRVVRQGDWKLQVTERPRKTWLFNLKDDPTEKRDLASSNPAKVAQMKALLAKHQKGARKPLYPHTIEAPVAIDKTSADRFKKGDAYVYWPN